MSPSIEGASLAQERSGSQMTDESSHSQAPRNQAKAAVDHKSLLGQIKAWCNNVSAASVPYDWVKRRQEILYYLAMLLRIQDPTKKEWQGEIDELARVVNSLDKTVSRVTGSKGLGPTLEFAPPEPRETNRLPPVEPGLKLVEGAGFLEPNMQREMQELQQGQDDERKPDAGILFKFPDAAADSFGDTDRNLFTYTKLYKEYPDNRAEAAREARADADKGLASPTGMGCRQHPMVDIPANVNGAVSALTARIEETRKLLAEYTVLAQDLRRARRQYPRPLMDDIAQLVHAGLTGLDVPAELEFRSEEYFVPYKDRLRLLNEQEAKLLRYLCRPLRPEADTGEWTDAECALRRAVEGMLLSKDMHSPFQDTAWISAYALLDATKERERDDEAIQSLSVCDIEAGVKRLADLKMIDYDVLSSSDFLGVRRYQPLHFPEALMRWQYIGTLDERNFAKGNRDSSFPIPLPESDGQAFMQSADVRRKTTSFFRCLAFRLGLSLKTYRERRKEDREFIREARSRKHNVGAPIEAAGPWKEITMKVSESEREEACEGPSTASLLDIAKATESNIEKRALINDIESKKMAKRFLQRQLIAEASHDPYLIRAPFGNGYRASKPSEGRLWDWANPRSRKTKMTRRWDVNCWPKAFTNEAVGIGLQTTWKTFEQQQQQQQQQQHGLGNAELPHLDRMADHLPYLSRVSYKDDALCQRLERYKTNFWAADSADTPLEKRYEKKNIGKRFEAERPLTIRRTMENTSSFREGPLKRRYEEVIAPPCLSKLAPQSVRLPPDHEHHPIKKCKLHQDNNLATNLQPHQHLAFPYAEYPQHRDEGAAAPSLLERIPGLDEQKRKRGAEAIMAEVREMNVAEVPALESLHLPREEYNPTESMSLQDKSRACDEIAAQLENDAQMEWERTIREAAGTSIRRTWISVADPFRIRQGIKFMLSKLRAAAPARNPSDMDRTELDRQGIEVQLENDALMERERMSRGEREGCLGVDTLEESQTMHHAVTSIGDEQAQIEPDVIMEGEGVLPEVIEAQFEGEPQPAVDRISLGEADLDELEARLQQSNVAEVEVVEISEDNSSQEDIVLWQAPEAGMVLNASPQLGEGFLMSGALPAEDEANILKLLEATQGAEADLPLAISPSTLLTPIAEESTLNMQFADMSDAALPEVVSIPGPYLGIAMPILDEVPQSEQQLQVEEQPSSHDSIRVDEAPQVKTKEVRANTREPTPPHSVPQTPAQIMAQKFTTQIPTPDSTAFQNRVCDPHLPDGAAQGERMKGAVEESPLKRKVAFSRYSGEDEGDQDEDEDAEFAPPPRKRPKRVKLTFGNRRTRRAKEVAKRRATERFNRQRPLNPRKPEESKTIAPNQGWFWTLKGWKKELYHQEARVDLKLIEPEKDPAEGYISDESQPYYRIVYGRYAGSYEGSKG